MAKWDSTEAPVAVVVDDLEAYSGHMDDRPLKLAVDAEDEHVAVTHDDLSFKQLQASMSPGEAYHLSDDLIGAADACWSGAEYVVMAVVDGTRRYAGEIKASDPADAVDRLRSLYKSTWKESGSEHAKDRLVLTDNAERFDVFRSDSMTTINDD